MSETFVSPAWAALQPIQDPELGYSIVDLGLVYAIAQPTPEQVVVTMTLTTPTCPLQEQLTMQITQALQALPGINQVRVEFTFTPRWSLAKAATFVQEELALKGIPLASW